MIGLRNGKGKEKMVESKRICQEKKEILELKMVGESINWVN